MVVSKIVRLVKRVLKTLLILVCSMNNHRLSGIASPDFLIYQTIGYIVLDSTNNCMQNKWV